MKYLLFIFLLTTSFVNIPIHEYYVSTCHIEHNSTEKTLEIAFNIFTDDFEKGVDVATGPNSCHHFIVFK